MRAFRPSRGKLLLTAIWAAGVGVVCWLVPTWPRDGWQPAADDHFCGLLQDGKTLVICKLVHRQTETEQPVYGGPVLLRDIDTGAVRGSYFSSADQFELVIADWYTDILHVGRRIPDLAKTTTHVLLYDAVSGRELVDLNHSALHRTGYWALSPDGRMAAACGTDENGRRRIAICDTATGRRLCQFPDCDSGRFSPDGRRFAANKRPGDILIFEVPSGRQVSELPNTAGPQVWNYFRGFSRDGKYVLDDRNQVWDADHGKVVFTVPSLYNGLPLFAIDGKTVVTVGASQTEAWVAHYDIATGQELVDRRVPLIGLPPGAPRAPVFRLGTGGAKNDGIYCAEFYREDLPLPRQLNWVRRFPTIQQWVQPHFGNVSVVLDAISGRELGRLQPMVMRITPDVRYAITGPYQFRIWDIPARRPLRWLIGSVEAWSLLYLVSDPSPAPLPPRHSPRGRSTAGLIVHASRLASSIIAGARKPGGKITQPHSFGSSAETYFAAASFAGRNSTVAGGDRPSEQIADDLRQRRQVTSPAARRCCRARPCSARGGCGR